MLNSANLSQSRNLLLLSLLLALCIYTALSSMLALVPVDGQYSTILLTKANYASFTALAICLVSYFPFRRFFKRTLGLTLLLSLFGLVNFLPVSVSIGINLGELQLGIAPFSCLLLLIYYFLNRTSARVFIRNYLLPAPSPQQVARQQREAIDQFKQTFARKTDGSLQEIVQAQKLVPYAIAAAHELLQERKPTQSASSKATQ